MTPKYETSESIVAGIGKGDREAETAMIEKYSRALLYVLEKRTGDREKAKDLQQDAFIVVLQKLRREPISDPSKLAAYLQNTAINLHIGELRKEQRRNTKADTELLEILEASSNDQYTSLLRSKTKLVVKRLLDELRNERDKLILKLYYIEESDKESICSNLELDHRHFDRVIFRAKSRFREIVEQHKEEIPLEMTV